jgi:hypothetical protein
LRYRRASFEQLEERRALATVTLGVGAVVPSGIGSAMTQFEAAAFPRVIQLDTDVRLTLPEASITPDGSSSILGLTRQQEPLLVLPSVDGRPVAASIDRIQATAGVETNVKLRQELPGEGGNRATYDTPSMVRQTGSVPAPPADVKPIGRFVSPSPAVTRREVTLQPSPGNADVKLPSPQDARAAVAVGDSAPVNSRSNFATPERKSIQSNEKPPVDDSAFAGRSLQLPADDFGATELLLKRPGRSSPVDTASPKADGREYLSGVQTMIFASAAIATALVLPGIISEIRRRRKHTLPLVARAPLRSTETADELSDDAATTLPIREKAG